MWLFPLCNTITSLCIVKDVGLCPLDWSSSFKTNLGVVERSWQHLLHLVAKSWYQLSLYDWLLPRPFINSLAYRPATRSFQLDLRGYSVASLPRALRFALASRLLYSRPFCASRSRKFSKKKCVSIDSKCSGTRKHAETKKNFYPFDPLRDSRIARS